MPSSAISMDTAPKNTIFASSLELFPALARRSAEWFMQEEKWRRSRSFCHKILSAFTVHPAETNESYLAHLWFTIKTSLRFLLLGLLLFTHGVFPFFFTRTVSKQIEAIYRMMRARIPKNRLDTMDSEYTI